jgi:hypothetical protein
MSATAQSMLDRFNTDNPADHGVEERFYPVDDGDLTVAIQIEMDEFESQGDKIPYIQFAFTVQDGRYEGKTFRDDRYVFWPGEPPNDGVRMARDIAFGTLNKMFMNILGVTKEDLDDFGGYGYVVEACNTLLEGDAPPLFEVRNTRKPRKKDPSKIDCRTRIQRRID